MLKLFAPPSLVIPPRFPFRSFWEVVNCVCEFHFAFYFGRNIYFLVSFVHWLVFFLWLMHKLLVKLKRISLYNLWRSSLLHFFLVTPWVLLFFEITVLGCRRWLLYRTYCTVLAGPARFVFCLQYGVGCLPGCVSLKFPIGLVYSGSYGPVWS